MIFLWQVSKLPTENRSDDLTSLDDSSHAVSECTQSRCAITVTDYQMLK